MNSTLKLKWETDSVVLLSPCFPLLIGFPPRLDSSSLLLVLQVTQTNQTAYCDEYLSMNIAKNLSRRVRISVGPLQILEFPENLRLLRALGLLSIIFIPKRI